MRQILNFWWTCIKAAISGSSQFANDWQWVYGTPVLGVLAGAVAGFTSQDGSIMLIQHHPILNGLVVAFLVFVITWIVGVLIQIPVIAARKYLHAEKLANDLEEKLKPKIRLIELVEVQHLTRDGEMDQEYLLRIENTGATPLTNCLVSLDGIERMPSTFHIPRALRTWTQREQERTGPFTLRAEQKKLVPLCHLRCTPGNTFTVANIDYEDKKLADSFVAEETSFLDIGLYSDGPALKFRLLVSVSINAETKFRTLGLSVWS